MKAFLYTLLFIILGVFWGAFLAGDITQPTNLDYLSLCLLSVILYKISRLEDRLD